MRYNAIKYVPYAEEGPSSEREGCTFVRGRTQQAQQLQRVSPDRHQPALQQTLRPTAASQSIEASLAYSEFQRDPEVLGSQEVSRLHLSLRNIVQNEVETTIPAVEQHNSVVQTALSRRIAQGKSAYKQPQPSCIA